MRLSSLTLDALKPRLCDPVITTGLAPNGSSTITLLWTCTPLPSTSVFQLWNVSLMFFGTIESYRRRWGGLSPPLNSVTGLAGVAGSTTACFFGSAVASVVRLAISWLTTPRT